MSEELKPAAVHDANVFLPGSLGPVRREVVLAYEHDRVVDQLRAELSALKAGQGEAVAWSLPDMETSMVLHSAWLKLSGEGQPSIETLKSHYSAISAALADTVPPASAADVSVPRELLELLRLAWKHMPSPESPDLDPQHVDELVMWHVQASAILARQEVKS